MSTEERNGGIQLRADEDGEGQFQGYFVKWDQVDSYNTKFQRGCFAKSIAERMDKIVARDNHGKPMGKPTEIREDEIGAFVVAQTSMDVQHAREAFLLIRDRVVTGLSFGFEAIKDMFDNSGVRTFTEVKLLEVSPTWLPAGDDSRITGFRSGESKGLEYRSTDFQESVLEETRWMLDEARWSTDWDIWHAWSSGNMTNQEAMAAFDKMLSDYHAAYLDFVSKWIMGNSSERSVPLTGISLAIQAELKERNQTIDDFAKSTQLTTDDVTSLCRNQHIADTAKSKLLPENLRNANMQARNNQVEEMFTGLRSYLTTAEQSRASSLLSTMQVKGDVNTNKDSLMGRSSDILNILNQMNGTKNDRS